MCLLCFKALGKVRMLLSTVNVLTKARFLGKSFMVTVVKVDQNSGSGCHYIELAEGADF